MNNAEAQQILINHGLLDPPADGKWGVQSSLALQSFQKLYGLPVDGQLSLTVIEALQREKPQSLDLSAGDFAAKICRFMLTRGMWLSRGSSRYNLVYVEGVNVDGAVNADIPNEWNDRRLAIEISVARPIIVGNWLASTEPGDHYTYYPLNPSGAFRIAFGQYLNRWQLGLHGQKSPHEALVQTGVLTGFRDLNQDFLRTGDREFSGAGFGINQHCGYGLPKVGVASAGCLVVRDWADHQESVALWKADRRYRENKYYLFSTTILDGSQL